MWNQSNEWLVPLQHDQDSLLDVCALIFALDSLQTINSVCVDPPFVWYLCILDLSVQQEVLYWAFPRLLTAGTPRYFCSAHAEKPQSVWQHSGNWKCTMQLIAACRVCLMHGTVRYRVCPDSVHSTCRECWFSLGGLHFCCLCHEVSAGNITGLI